jgi:PKD repeat protein
MFDEVTFTVTPQNLAPVVNIPASEAFNLGQVLWLTPGYFDAGNDARAGWSVDWGDGTVETPDAGLQGFSHLYAQAGEYRVVITATDADGAVSVEDSILVTVSNIAPVWAPVFPETLNEGEALSLALDQFLEDSTGMSYQLLSGPDGLSVDANTGLLSWQTDTDDDGTHRVTVRAVNAADTSLQATLRFDVIVDRVPPEVSVAIPQSGQIGQAVTLTPDSSATDADGIDRWRVFWGDGSSDTYNGDVASFSHVFLNEGSFGVRVTAYDTDGLATDLIYQAIDITDPADTTIRAVQGTDFSLDASTLIAPQPGESLTYSIDREPSGMVIDAATGLITWDVPERGRSAWMLPQVTITRDSDGAVLYDDRLRIRRVNPDPVVTLEGDSTVQVNQPYVLTLNADDPDGDPIAYWRIAWGDGASEIVAGSVTEVTHTYESRQNATITVQAYDADSGRSTAKIRGLRVLDNANSAIQMAYVPTMGVQAGETTTFDLSAYVRDLEGDTLSFAVQSGPEGMSIDATTGVITWDVAAHATGKLRSYIRVSDDNAAGAVSRLVQVNFNVSAEQPQPSSNQAPRWQGISTQTGELGAELSIDLSAFASDPNGDGITYHLLSAPEGAVIDPVTGLFTWTASSDFYGRNAVVQVAAVDDAAVSKTAVRTFGIRLNRTAPVVDFTLNTTDAATKTATLVPQVDAGNARDIVAYEITWGDGVVETIAADQPLTHQYDLGGNHSIRVQAIDSHGIKSRGHRLTASFSAVDLVSLPRGEMAVMHLEPLIGAVPRNGSMQVTNAPAGLTVGDDGVLRWDVPLDAAASVTFELQRLNSSGVAVGLSKTITIRTLSPAPVAQANGADSAIQGGSYALSLSASDVEGDAISHFLINWGDGTLSRVDGSQSSATHVFTQPHAERSVRVVAVDEHGRRSAAAVQTVVVAANAAPIWSAIPAQTHEAGDSIVLDLSPYAVDPDGGDVVLDLVSGPVGATLDSQTGVLSWTANALSDPAPLQFTVRATDDENSSTEQVIGFTIDMPAAPAPVVPVANQPQLSVAPATARESEGVMTFTIALSAPTVEPVEMFFNVLPMGGAVAGVDYTPVASGMVIIPAGRTSTSIDVPLIRDLLEEDHESLMLEVFGVRGAQLATGGFKLSVTGTILDDDTDPVENGVDIGGSHAQNPAEIVWN